MRKIIQIILIITCLLSTLSLMGGSRTEIARKAYIATYKPYALMVELRYGVPASICMAQALLETDAGRSNLNLIGNNHFGIKAGRLWAGKTMQKIDDKVNSEGKLIPSQFRVYPDPAASFKNYGQMLSTSSRYKSLLQIDKADYRTWAHGIAQKGYATNPQYAQLLIHLIKRYELDKLSLMEVQRIPKIEALVSESTTVQAAVLSDQFFQFEEKSLFQHLCLLNLTLFTTLLMLVFYPKAFKAQES